MQILQFRRNTSYHRIFPSVCTMPDWLQSEWRMVLHCGTKSGKICCILLSFPSILSFTGPLCEKLWMNNAASLILFISPLNQAHQIKHMQVVLICVCLTSSPYNWLIKPTINKQTGLQCTGMLINRTCLTHLLIWIFSLWAFERSTQTTNHCTAPTVENYRQAVIVCPVFAFIEQIEKLK